MRARAISLALDTHCVCGYLYPFQETATNTPHKPLGYRTEAEVMTTTGSKYDEDTMCKESKSLVEDEQIIGLMQDDQYKRWITDVSRRFKSSQIKAAIKVNDEMLRFYWSLGRDIVEMKAESRWGTAFFEVLSKDITQIIPDSKGFSPRNLRYMRDYYVLFNSAKEFLPQVVAKSDQAKSLPQLGVKSESVSVSDEIFLIPWGHIRTIIDKCKGNRDKALFYVHKTLENSWSRAVLLNFLDTDLFERQGKAITNFAHTLPEPLSDLAQQITKDPYTFDFLTLTERYEEKELKQALIGNIERFLMELGKGFAYMGREYRLEVGNEERFIDMLFYHTGLHCYVVIEVKVQKFDPADLGQLGFYVSAVNHILKKDGDNPTIGLLVCKTKDDVVAQYTLEGTNLPLGISEYELSKLYPVDFKSSLPNIEEIEAELSRDL